jgi:hypothetical protein
MYNGSMNIKIMRSQEAEHWLLEKHYARRKPIIKFCFGLIENNKVEGVCTFGPPARQLQFPDVYRKPLELNRLCVNDGLGKNILSQFVSGCLAKFPIPTILVSYADENQGHYGYIYQATNWVYTGKSSAERKVFIDGKLKHRRSLNSIYGTSSIEGLIEMGLNVTTEDQVGKHRYFQFTGSRRDKKFLRKQMLKRYEIIPYPKGDNCRYDAGTNHDQLYDKWAGIFD